MTQTSSGLIHHSSCGYTVSSIVEINGPGAGMAVCLHQSDIIYGRVVRFENFSGGKPYLNNEQFKSQERAVDRQIRQIVQLGGRHNMPLPRDFDF